MTRIFDILFSGIAILILSPLLIPIMLLLKLTGEHYIFYRQIRIGINGKEFGLLKFATMLKDSPNLPGGLYTSKNDPRLLPMGKFLRKSKINELPQLLNIFIGQMSFVGYRPTVPVHFEYYPETAKRILHNIRPGLTGIGSIVFRDEEEILQEFENKQEYHKNVITPYKAALECWYAENRTVFLYFKIIFLTAITVIFPKSELWKKWFKNLPPIPQKLEGYI